MFWPCHHRSDLFSVITVHIEQMATGYQGSDGADGQLFNSCLERSEGADDFCLALHHCSDGADGQVFSPCQDCSDKSNHHWLAVLITVSLELMFSCLAD